MIDYVIASIEHTEQVYKLVQETIKKIYPKYYPKEVVDFFSQHHSIEKVQEDIENKLVGILKENHTIIGTGCYQENHITRVYVLPGYQGRGYGSYIMQCLESEIAKRYNKVYLDASLPASHFYEERGYITTKHCRYNVENGVILVYEIMEKSFEKDKRPKANSNINNVKELNITY